MVERSFPFLDGSSPYPYTAESLDIVRDCDELTGSFPPSVEFKLIYCGHYVGTPASAGSLRRATTLASHLMQASVVGLEIGAVEDVEDPAYAIPEEYEIINRAISEGLSKDEVRPLYERADISFTSGWQRVADIVDQMRSLGAKYLPMFVPIDTYFRSSTKSVSNILLSGSSLTQLEIAKLISAESRQREGTVLRQLHAYAQAIGEDNRHKQIAVIEGTDHFLTATALRTLGAQASEVFLDRPSLDVDTFLEHTIRFGADQEMIAQAADMAGRSDRLAYRLLKLASSLRLVEAGLLEDDSASPLLSALGLLVLRSELDTLSEDQLHQFKRQLGSVTPFLQSALPSHKRRIRHSMQGILDLSQALIQQQ